MSLQQWANNGWLRPHETSPKEIQDLLAIVKRDLADAEGDISAVWQFGIAYNAALKLCTLLMHASGYPLRPGTGRGRLRLWLMRSCSFVFIRGSIPPFLISAFCFLLSAFLFVSISAFELVRCPVVP
jgi:hypothetical protein